MGRNRSPADPDPNGRRGAVGGVGGLTRLPLAARDAPEIPSPPRSLAAPAPTGPAEPRPRLGPRTPMGIGSFAMAPENGVARSGAVRVLETEVEVEVEPSLETRGLILER